MILKQALSEDMYGELEQILENKRVEKFTGTVTLVFNYRKGGIGELSVKEARNIKKKDREKKDFRKG